MSYRKLSLLLFLSLSLGLAGCDKEGSKQDKGAGLALLLALGGPGDSELSERRFSFAYQITPRLFQELGAFYFAGSPPAISELTDFAVSDLFPAADPVDLSAGVPVTLWLDGANGVLAYTSGKDSFGHFQDSALSFARGVEISQDGRILLIESDRKLNTCLRYERGSVASGTDCKHGATADQARFYVGDSFDVVARRGDTVFLFNSKTGAASAAIDHKLTGPVVGVAAIPSGFAVIGEGGKAVGVYDRGGILLDKFDSPSIRYDDGTESGAVRLAGIAAEKSGAFIGVSGDLLLRMDGNFQLIRAIRIPSLPLSMERLQTLKGLYSLADPRGVYVFAANGFSVFENSSAGSPTTAYFPTPSQLTVVEEAASDNILSIMESLRENPSQNVLDIPEIKGAIDAARAEL